MKKNAEAPKLIFVDVYTSWCGWCKVMDNQTFANEEIQNLLAPHFYTVKFNAETKDTINFSNHTFVSSNTGLSRSSHQLALSLLDNEMSYPSFVVLNEKFERLNILKGYKDVEFMKEYLQFYIEGKYKE